MGVHMNVARRRAVVAGLVTGGLLVAGLSASSQSPAFASAVDSSPSPSPAAASATPGPCLRHAEPIAIDARAHHERQPGPFHVPFADIHTLPDRLHISDPYAEHELGSFHVSRPDDQSNALGIVQPDVLRVLSPFGLGYRQPGTTSPRTSHRRSAASRRPGPRRTQNSAVDSLIGAGGAVSPLGAIQAAAMPGPIPNVTSAPPSSAAGTRPGSSRRSRLPPPPARARRVPTRRPSAASARPGRRWASSPVRPRRRHWGSSPWWSPSCW